MEGGREEEKGRERGRERKREGDGGREGEPLVSHISSSTHCSVLQS